MSSSPAPTSTAPLALSTRWLDDWAEAAPWREPWNALAQGLFTRYEWFDAAWAWARRDAQCRVLLVLAGARLVGVLPACQRGRELQLITVPDTQFADVLLGPEAQRVAAAMAQALARSGAWTRLRLTHLAPDGQWQALAAALPASFRTQVEAYSRNLRIALDAPWAPYYAGLSKTVREKNKLAANRLARAGGVSAEWRRGPEAAAVLPEVVAISAASWKQETGLSLDQPGPGAFLARLAEHAAPAGWLSIWIARHQGQAAAMELQLIDEGAVYALRSDFRAEFAQVSPGTWLNWQLLERLSGQGWRDYFMGPGENAYKLRWTQSGATLMQLRAWHPGWRGCVSHWFDERFKPWARRLRDAWRARRPDPAAPTPLEPSSRKDEA